MPLPGHIVCLWSGVCCAPAGGGKKMRYMREYVPEDEVTKCVLTPIPASKRRVPASRMPWDLLEE